MESDKSNERNSIYKLNDKFKDMPGYKVETLSVLCSEDESKIKNASELSQKSENREMLINCK